jgi:glycosyltransferase involved in cell wall biosynthesis
MARVFVGVPTLNRPEWVRETVASVLAQSFGDFRLVVSDNCSEPEAVASVRRYVDELGDPRVRFHQQPENRREYGQGRYFFGEAREEFFVILHDDDRLEPGYLARAVECLEREPQAALFIADPYVFDESGRRWPERTAGYLREHGRSAGRAGQFDVLRTLLESGFAPISGTCFRLAALRESGFVDPGCEGNYPFEMNVLIRLGERGALGVYCPEELLGFRFHRNSQRVYAGLMDNRRVVDTMTQILEARQFTGWCERRRRQILGKLHRATALRRLREGDDVGCQSALRQAFRANPFSLRLLAASPLALLAPGLLRSLLPSLQSTSEGPRVAVRPPSLGSGTSV